MGYRRGDRRQRGRSRSAITVWVLIVGFLLQPVLTYLATPLMAVDGAGERVVICTLEGLKEIALDLPQPGDHGDDEQCPALQLLQLVHSAQLAEPPQLPAALLYAVAQVAPRAEHHYHTQWFHAYSTRAPPSVS